MRRLLLLTAGLLVLAAPGAAPAAVTKTAWSLTATGLGATGQSCKIVGYLWKDSAVSKADPAPAVLATNGFGGSRDDFNDLGPAMAARGYVFASYSGLGFGGSECKITLDDPDTDGRAAKQIVAALAGTRPLDGVGTVDFVTLDGPGDPRLGMIGGSYGGQVQFAAAGVTPEIDAIIPQITWNQLGYSLAPNNTGFVRGVDYDFARAPGVEKAGWVNLFFGLGIAQGTQAIAMGDATKAGGLCVNFPDQACLGKAEMDSQGYPSQATTDFIRHASVSSYLAKIKIPTFLAQGENDTLFNMQEAVATYNALRSQGTPVKMLWRSAGHSGGGLGKSESNSTAPETAYESRAALEWFDFYLRGAGDPPRMEFSYFRDYVTYPKDGDAAPAVATAPAYPVAPDVPFYLSGSDALVGDAKAAQPGSASFVVDPTLPPSTSGKAGPFPQPPLFDTPGTFAAFTSAPLAETIDVVGVPRVTVTLSAPTFAASQGSPAGQLILFAKLYDVGPDGAKELPQRLLSPVRVADVTKPLAIELPGIVHRFAKGHRLQLVLASSDADYYRSNTLAGPVSVTVDLKAPSALALPVLGGTPPPPVAAPKGSQDPGAGANKAVLALRKAAAAKLPKACASRRAFSITLAKPAKGDRIVSVTITVNGKRKTVVRGAKLRVPVRLSGLPKGTYRVVVTAKTAKKRTLRSARTYATCAR
jgi:ABC-2 type transport system ATP-binding protein